MSNTNVIDWAIRANDSGFASVMRGVVDTLAGVKRGSAGAASAVGDLGGAAATAAGQWTKNRRELESLYVSMGKLPSKEVVAELDKIERKYLSLASAAEGGNRAAADAMRGLLSKARATVTADTMADPAAGRGSIMERSMTAATSSMKAAVAGLAAAFTVAAFATRIKEQISLADAFGKAAQKAGVSVEAITSLSYASKFAGIDTETLTSSLSKLGKTMVDAETGGKRTAAVFQTMGVSLKDQEGKMRGTDQVLLDLAERFSTMPDGAEKTALAMELFGKKGADLLPFLNSGRDGIEQLQEEARKMGLVLSGDAAAAAGSFNDMLDRMHAKTEGVWRQLAVRLLPTLMNAAEGFSEASEQGGAMDAVMTSIDWTLKGLVLTGGALATGFKQLGIVIGGVAAAAVNAATGDFSSARAVLGMMTEDIKEADAAWLAFADRVAKGKTTPGAAPKPAKPADMEPIGKLGAPAAKSRVSEWDNELDRMKLAHQKMTAEEGVFIEFSRDRERAFWKAKLDNAVMSSDERFAVEKKYLAAVQSINAEAFGSSIAAQKNQMAEMEKNYVAQLAVAQDIAARIQKAYGSDSKQYADAQRQLITLQRQADDQKRQLIDLALADQRSAASQSIALEQQQAQLSFNLGLINRKQLLAMELDYQAQLQEISRQALERRRDTTDPEKDPVAYQQILNQLLEQERTFQLAKRKLAGDLHVEANAPAKAAFSSMESSFSSAADGMLNRAQSWRQSMANIFTSTGTAFIQEMAVKPVARFAASMAERLFLTSTTTAAEVGVETAAAGVKTAASAAAATVQGANNAVVAGTGVAAALAGIPIIGPALAAAGMPAMLALVMGTVGMIASARGGYDIPAGINPLTQLHEEEMVLPARVANVIRGMASRSSEDGAGGGDAFHFAPVIQAMDARGVDRVLESHGRKFIDYLQQNKRKFG